MNVRGAGRWLRTLAESGEDGQPSLGRWIALSLLIGVVAGLGAVVMQDAIEFANRLSLGGIAGYVPPGLISEGGTAAPAYLSHYRWWLFLLVPALGGLLTGLIVYTFAPEAEGHGTDAVIRAYHREGGYIRARVPIVKIIASAITLGSGGSGGREGPIAQVGAGFGAWLATALRVPDRERRLMVLAGAAGGIGAIFRAPLGGALVVCELLYRNSEFEYDAVVPALLTSVVAYSVYALFNGWAPMFATSPAPFDQPQKLLVYLVLGVAVAALGWVYVSVFYGLRDRVFARLPFPRHFRPALGGFLTGLVGLAAPQAIGLGYGWIQMGIAGQLSVRDYLAGALGKILATGFSISSGGSGGVFGPAVVIGGFTGGAVGTFFARLLPTWGLQPQAFILVGMAAFFGGAAKAPIGALLMISEMTAGYGLLVPLIVACAVAAVLVPKRVSIYEEQVDGRVNSPAHFDEYLRQVQRTLQAQAETQPTPAQRDMTEHLSRLLASADTEAKPAPELGKATFLDVKIPPKSPAAGRYVREVRLGDGVLIVAIRRGEETVVPSGSAQLMAGDHVIVLAGPGKSEGVLDSLERPAARPPGTT
jgi:chloride channel protein, CIC family